MSLLPGVWIMDVPSVRNKYQGQVVCMQTGGPAGAGNDRPEVSGPEYSGLLCHLDISLFSSHPASDILTYVSHVVASGTL